MVGHEDKTEDLATVPGAMTRAASHVEAEAPRQPFLTEARLKLALAATLLANVSAMGGVIVKGYDKWEQVTKNTKAIQRLDSMIPIQCKMCWFQIHSADAERVCAGGDPQHICWQFKPLSRGAPPP